MNDNDLLWGMIVVIIIFEALFQLWLGQSFVLLVVGLIGGLQ